MLVVRGTKKFLDRTGGPGPEGGASSGALGDWYATVWFWKPQVALFVNERTRLPVLVPMAPASSVLDRFPPAFAALATRIGVDDARLATELEAMRHTVLAKTASRSVLGTMSDFKQMADHGRWLDGPGDIVKTALWLAHVPLGPLDYSSADRALRAALSSPRTALTQEASE